MSPKAAQDPEEAKLNAELAAEHAEKAVEAADEADLAAARAGADGRVCLHCHTEMVKHTDADPEKAGCWHCNGCGCCFRGNAVREGHTPCPLAVAAG